MNRHDKTTEEAWRTAQEWERSFWLRNQANMKKYGKNIAWKILSVLGLKDQYRGNDRNNWWRDHYEGYKFLPESLDNVIEVGCGPYTNMRHIQNICTPNHLVLSDPLIKTYVKFPMTYVQEKYRKASCSLDDHPIEELPFAKNYFDLAVMINVLDHVCDAELCMRNLIDVIKPNGIIIIGQDLTNSEGRANTPSGYRTGHPITLDKEWFTPYLSVFSPIINKTVHVSSEWEKGIHYGSLIYAGRKHSDI